MNYALWPLSTVLSVIASLAPAPMFADIRLGAAAPLAENLALLGEQLELGAQRAALDLNDAGGLLGEDVTFISVDDGCDEDQAVAAARQLVAAEVVAVIGHFCSRTSIAASEIYDAAGVIMISPASTNPVVTDRGLAGVFRTIGRDDDQSAIASDFILEEFGDRSIALLHDGNLYGKELATGVKEALNAAGTTEVLFAPFEANQPSYADVIETVIASGADVVYAVGNGVNDIALLTRQLKSSNPDAVVVSADSIAGNAFYLVAGDAAQGTFFTFGPDARLSPVAATVVDRFRNEDAYEPDGVTLYSYAAVQAWAQAVQAAGSVEQGAVIAELKSRTFDTVIGTIGFDDKGDVTGVDNFVIYRWGTDGYSQIE